MSSAHPWLTARSEGLPETIFDLIADMPNCGRWLPASEAFGGTTEVPIWSSRHDLSRSGTGGPEARLRHGVSQVGRK